MCLLLLFLIASLTLLHT